MVTALFPITYQKLNEDWDVHARVPKTTCASPETSGPRTSARSAARYSRSASRIAANSSVACRSAVRIAAPFPRLRSWKTTLTFSATPGRRGAPEFRRSTRRRRSQARGWRLELSAQGVLDRRLDRRALVEHGQDGEAAGHPSRVRPARPDASYRYGVGATRASTGESPERPQDRLGCRIRLQRGCRDRDRLLESPAQCRNLRPRPGTSDGGNVSAELVHPVTVSSSRVSIS